MTKLVCSAQGSFKSGLRLRLILTGVFLTELKLGTRGWCSQLPVMGNSSSVQGCRGVSCVDMLSCVTACAAILLMPWGGGGVRHTLCASFCPLGPVHARCWGCHQGLEHHMFCRDACHFREGVELKRGRLRERGGGGGMLVLGTFWKDSEETASPCASALTGLRPHWETSRRSRF